MGQILLAAILGTTLMTVFSYAWSRARRKQFREPVLLNRVFNRPSPHKNAAGWSVHYLIGFLFVLIFYLLWASAIIQPSIVSGAALGLAAGLIGISGWTVVLALHPLPEVDIKEHYVQLIVAHIIFGVGAALGYLLPLWMK